MPTNVLEYADKNNPELLSDFMKSANEIGDKINFLMKDESILAFLDT